MPQRQRIRLRDLQCEVEEWSSKNFERSELGYHALLGILEELGELAHAHLKELQGIRGTPWQHQLAAHDAIGDLMIFLTDYCNQRNWDLETIICKTWKIVRKRNWKDNPTDGHIKKGVNEK